MTDRRGSRFLLEVLFLLALTVALTLTTLPPLEIAGIMFIGWVIVAAFEWVAWREEPHFGSGLPPRYYVPQVNLPPAQPLEPVPAGYPEARDEAPTWIASPALRAEMLGEAKVGDWPLAAPPEDQGAETDPWTTAGELPVVTLSETETETETETEPAPAPGGAVEPEPAFIPPPLSPPVQAAAVSPPVVLPPLPEDELDPEPEPEFEPAAASEPEPSLDVQLVRSVQGVAHYSLDPLGDQQPRRRFGRGGEPEPAGVEVPARPVGPRALPSRANRQD